MINDPHDLISGYAYAQEQLQGVLGCDWSCVLKYEGCLLIGPQYHKVRLQSGTRLAILLFYSQSSQTINLKPGTVGATGFREVRGKTYFFRSVLKTVCYHFEISPPNNTILEMKSDKIVC